LAVGVPAASATFSDVPPSNPFYADINAIQGAGSTQGCGGGNFCPTDPIQRQAEAAFIHRAAGRAGISSTNEVPIGDGAVHLGAVTLSIGGAAGRTQFVKLDAAVTTYISGSSDVPAQLRT
jgi:hypothetical protein